MNKKKSNIILIGVKHSGKSTIGKILAEERNRLFFDLDETIEKLNSRSLKFTSRELYNKLGFDDFSMLETEALKKIFLHSKDNNIVLSLGGGTVENSSAMKLLNNFGIYVYLEVKDPKILFNRIIKNGLPSYLSRDNSWKDFKYIFDRRSAKCSEIADITINPINGNPHLSALQINNTLKEFNYGW